MPTRKVLVLAMLGQLTLLGGMNLSGCKPPGAPAPPATIYDDAIALWKLDEQGGARADSIGSLDLTDNNTVHWSNMGPGPSEVVASFVAGNSEYLSLASFVAPDTWTVYGWIYPTGDSGTIFTAVDSWPNGNQFSVDFLNGSQIRVAAGDGSTVVTATTNAPPGHWSFLVAWYDEADKKVRICIDDGTVVASSALSGTAYRTPVTLKFNGNDGPNYITSRMSRVGLMNRVPTASEITSLYNSGFGKAYNALTAGELSGLVSFWKLDEASGNRADSYGSNTLTDNNTVGSVTNSYPANLPGRSAYFTAAEEESLSNASDLGIDWTGPWEIAFWIKGETFGTHRRIISTAMLPLDAYWNPSSTTAVYDVVGGSVTRNFTLSFGDWHLVTLRHDPATPGGGTSTYGVSVDGGAEDTFTGTTAVAATSFRLGVYADGSTHPFEGLLSTVALWDSLVPGGRGAELWNSGDGAPLP